MPILCRPSGVLQENIKKHLESKKESELERKRALDLEIGHPLTKSSAKRIRERAEASFTKPHKGPRKTICQKEASFQGASF